MALGVLEEGVAQLVALEQKLPLGEDHATGWTETLEEVKDITAANVML